MMPELVQWLCCPDCHSSLHLEALHTTGSPVTTGSLHCEGCARRFPVEEGIPRLLPGEVSNGLAHAQPGAQPMDAVVAEKVREIKMRDSAAKNYLTFFKGNETEIEHRNILRLTKFTPSCRVLEIGAGTGRITERYAALTTLTIASDYSFESLREQQKRTPPPILERIQLVQADGTALPFRDAAFDRVLSAGVLMHIPGAEMRDRFLAEASRVLLPNGLAVITGKNYSLYYQWMEYKREGRSEHGVITYSSTKAEYVNLLRKHFHVHDCLGFRYEIPKLTKYIGQPLLLDRLLQHMPLSSYCARAFIAQCSKTAPDMP